MVHTVGGFFMFIKGLPFRTILKRTDIQKIRQKMFINCMSDGLS